MCTNPEDVAHVRNCFSKIVVSLSRVESSRFSLRLLFRKRDTASLTVTRAGFGREASSSLCCFASNSSSSLRLKSSALSQLRGLGAATDEGAIRSENAIDPLWAPAALVVDVVGRARRIVARVNREHGISTFAES